MVSYDLLSKLIACRLCDLCNQLQDDNIEAEEFADYRKYVKAGKKGDIFNLVSIVASYVSERRLDFTQQ